MTTFAVVSGVAGAGLASEIVIVLGLANYQNLSRDSMPPYTVRVANVISEFPGAGPERVEQLVTDKIEKIAFVTIL